MSRKRSAVTFYAVILLVVAGLLGFERLFVDTRSFAAEETSELTKVEEKSIDVYLEINRLLTAVTTLVFGALGALIVKRGEKREQSGGEAMIWITASAGAVSLYCAYLNYSQLLWMLSNKFFDLSVPQVTWSARVQFGGFVVAAVSLAHLVYRGLDGVRR